MGYAISNKIVLVTGANRGIGKALVDTCIDRGAAKVYAAVRVLESATGLVEQHGKKVVPLHLDLTDGASILAAAKVASDVQVVVNNGGVLKKSAPLDIDAIESLQFEMDVNVYGLLRMAQAFAPVLKANGGGALVQLNSLASLVCFPNVATYCASKAASYSITQALRAQLGAQGTLVLSVHPGPIDTDMYVAGGFEGLNPEPPAVIAAGIVEGLTSGEFHVFADAMAQQLGGAYQSFAHNVILADNAE